MRKRESDKKGTGNQTSGKFILCILFCTEMNSIPDLIMDEQYLKQK